jgi:LmbE family N-acetylglucosaminyl deacetylase
MNILAISPHPDDMEFGCGGTLLEYAKRGENVYLLVLTGGEFGGKAPVRRKEQEKSAKFIGIKNVFWGEFIDTELVDDRNLITKIESLIQDIQPDIVLVNYLEDIHQDHRASAYATISAARNVKQVLFYESPTSVHFEPDIFVDISKVIEKKLHLLELHASQVNKTSVKNLTIIESARSCAIFRGYQGRVKFAEGFKGLRILRKI